MTVSNVGAITLFAGLYNIKGWAYCDGKTLPTDDFTELYEAIGNKYGGDENNFVLPNLQEHEKQLNGVKYQIALWENMYAPDPITGTVFLWVSDKLPDGCAFCDGALLRIQEYSALYSLIGTKYGGNGSTNFKVPNLAEAEKSLNGARYVICLEGIYPMRD